MTIQFQETAYCQYTSETFKYNRPLQSSTRNFTLYDHYKETRLVLALFLREETRKDKKSDD